MLQLVEMRLDRLLLLLDRLHQQVEGVPAGNEGKAMRAEQLLEGFRVVRPAMAVLYAVEADFRRLAQDLPGRDMGAQRLVVVIGPGDGIGAETDHILSSVHESLSSGAFKVARIGLLQFVRRSRFRHRSEEHTSELQSLMRNSYAVFCLKKKTYKQT